MDKENLKIEMFNHLRAIKDYCESIDPVIVAQNPVRVKCKGCVIEKQCEEHFKLAHEVPCEWELD